MADLLAMFGRYLLGIAGTASTGLMTPPAEGTLALSSIAFCSLATLSIGFAITSLTPGVDGAVTVGAVIGGETFGVVTDGETFGVVTVIGGLIWAKATEEVNPAAARAIIQKLRDMATPMMFEIPHYMAKRFA
jgi:hypothetical protein